MLKQACALSLVAGVACHRCEYYKFFLMHGQPLKDVNVLVLQPLVLTRAYPVTCDMGATRTLPRPPLTPTLSKQSSFLHGGVPLRGDSVVLHTTLIDCYIVSHFLPFHLSRASHDIVGIPTACLTSRCENENSTPTSSATKALVQVPFGVD